MAKGQEIDKLYISLGLDIDSLKLGFDTAGKTVSQSIARLNNENKKIRLQTDIDLEKLKGAGNAYEQIKVQVASLNKQLDIQRQKENILAAQLKQNYNAHGGDSYITQRSQMALLSQQKNIAELESRLRALNTTFTNIPKTSNNAFRAVSTGAEMAKSGLNKLSEGYGLLSAKMAAFLAVATTAGGLFNITKDAMMAGNNLYKLQQRLNITTAEAGQLNRAFSLAGTSINTLTPFIARIDKQLETAGENGNNTTKALQKFGITLTDESGNLLQINEQLEQLAKGYHNAAAAGETEAFTAEILGARGAALIPVLEEYNDLMAISKSVKTTGLLNPAEAHEAYLEWQKMNMELGQLKAAFGAALLPVSKELLPEITEGLTNMVNFIADNKDEIRLMGDILIDVMHEASSIVHTVADGLDAIGVNAANVGDVLRTIKAEFDSGNGLSMLMSMGNPATAIATYQALKNTTSVQEQKEYNESAEQSRKNEQAYWSRINQQVNARQREAQAQARQAEAAKKQAQEVANATAEMQEALYSLNHSELDTQLHAVDTAMKKYKEAGVSSVEIEKATQAQKAKIIKQFNDEVAKSIDSVWKSAYQNRLDEIEREKQAWEKKGLDEVKATRWAEEQKRQLQQETALSMFKENYKYLKIYRNAMAGYGDEGTKRATAMSLIAEQMRKDAGLPQDAWTTKEELAGFTDLMHLAKQNLVPVYDKNPTNFIWKGKDAVPMFSPDYEESIKNIRWKEVSPAINDSNVNYNLHVDVRGLEDVSNEVAQSAAKKIIDKLPNNNRVNISYGS